MRRLQSRDRLRGDRVGGKFFCSDVHMNGRQAGVSGIFELKIDNPSSKDLTGTAKTAANEKETKLAAAFHATLK
jgi:hypothetical protein